MNPLIVYSELSKKWYVATRWTQAGDGVVNVQRKYDVTLQMERIFEKRDKAKRRKR